MRPLFLIAFILFSTYSFGQIEGYTKDGKKIFLYANGTWKYNEMDTSSGFIIALDSIIARDTIRMNTGLFERNRSATHLVKSKKIDVGVYIDNRDWGIQRGSVNVGHEYMFLNKGSDCYAQLVTETTTNLHPDDWIQSSYNNLLSYAPDAQITEVEYRMVNGCKVISLEMVATIRRFKVTLLTYFYGNESGMAQLIGYATQKNYKKNKGIIEDLLNGIIIIK